ncbi:MAG: FHA domain-containing protein [Methanobacteriota archaeon]
MQAGSLEALADILQVLSNPARLALLVQLQRPRTVSELSVPPSRKDEGLDPTRPIARQSVERHLDLLSESGLVTWREDAARGRGRSFVLNHARLFAAVEELRTLTRLRATVAEPEDTIDLSGAAPPDPESVAGPRLVVLRGVPEDRIVPLPEGEAVLGRGTEAALRLDHDPFVSARHCRFLRSGHGASVREEPENRNGTFVNGRRLGAGESRTLRRGNLVAVGRSLLLYLD